MNSYELILNPPLCLPVYVQGTFFSFSENNNNEEFISLYIARALPSRQVQSHHLHWQPQPQHTQQRGHHDVVCDGQRHPNSHHPAAGAFFVADTALSSSSMATSSLQNHSDLHT
jgi:hypothetical protein